MNLFQNLLEKLGITFSYKNEIKDSNISKSNLKFTNDLKESSGNVQIIQTQGFSPQDVKDILSLALDNKDKVKVESLFNEKISERDQNLSKEINSRQGFSEITEEELAEPDNIATLNSARNISLIKDDDDYRKLLASFVVKKIKSSDNLTSLIFKKAIESLKDLDKEQLNIITVRLILGYTSDKTLVSWGKFKEYIDIKLSKFLEFKSSNANFQHIASVGCGNVSSIGSWDILKAWRETYSFFFQEITQGSEIEKYKTLPVFTRIFANKENGFTFRYLNPTILKSDLESQSIEPEIITELENLYRSKLKNNEEIEKYVTENTVHGGELIKKMQKGEMKRFNLTATGIAIGVTYFEEINKESIDLSPWLNETDE